MRKTSLSVLTTGLLLLSACAGLGSIGDILGSIGGTGQQQQQQGQIEAEIQQIDTNGQRIHVRTQNGQSGYVRFDSQTRVIYRQQQYPVTALERGDIVVMEVQQISQNELYASRIDVTQSVRDR
jgi:outer membrane biogenesis lipoprotein LolB